MHMDNQTGQEAAERRRERIRQMQLEKRRQQMRREMIKKYTPFALGGAALLLVVITCIALVIKNGAGSDSKAQLADNNDSRQLEIGFDTETAQIPDSTDTPDEPYINAAQGTDHSEPESAQVVSVPRVYKAQTTNDTLTPGENVISDHVIFLDKETGNILSQKGYKDVISPASMTKVLTLLVAAQQLGIYDRESEKLDDTFTMTIEITDYSYVNDCSNVGFDVGEVITVRDLFYGTILPSGADAAVGLAEYVAGTHEDFVALMNEKVKELGLSDTAHFTNCVGLYDEAHHCSVYDMAMIMEAALDNAFCREVLSAHTYTTTSTAEHPEGITISNWFLRRIEDKETGAEVVCGKTGFVVQSKNCAVSFGVDDSGREYICCTAGSTSSWRCIYDHVELYSQFSSATKG